ncbi:MAG: hypothetical protein AB1500_02025 [Bacillota bacterium]
MLKPGGTLAVAAHGPEFVREAFEITFRAMPKSLTLGYRVEFWPRREKDLSRMFGMAGLADVSTRRLTWKESFADGGKAYEFFAATSSAWWYAKVPSDKVPSVAKKLRNAFERKAVKEITTDIILAYGRKP